MRRRDFFERAAPRDGTCPDEREARLDIGDFACSRVSLIRTGRLGAVETRPFVRLVLIFLEDTASRYRRGGQPRKFWSYHDCAQSLLVDVIVERAANPLGSGGSENGRTIGCSSRGTSGGRRQAYRSARCKMRVLPYACAGAADALKDLTRT